MSFSTVRPIMDDPNRIASCDNCGWRGPCHNTKHIKDPSDRLYAGEECPAGECPECGTLAYLEPYPRRHVAETAAEYCGRDEVNAALPGIVQQVAQSLVSDFSLKTTLQAVKDMDGEEVSGRYDMVVWMMRPGENGIHPHLIQFTVDWKSSHRLIVDCGTWPAYFRQCTINTVTPHAIGKKDPFCTFANNRPPRQIAAGIHRQLLPQIKKLWPECEEKAVKWQRSNDTRQRLLNEYASTLGYTMSDHDRKNEYFTVHIGETSVFVAARTDDRIAVDISTDPSTALKIIEKLP